MSQHTKSITRQGFLFLQNSITIFFIVFSCQVCLCVFLLHTIVRTNKQFSEIVYVARLIRKKKTEINCPKRYAVHSLLNDLTVKKNMPKERIIFTKGKNIVLLVLLHYQKLPLCHLFEFYFCYFSDHRRLKKCNQVNTFFTSLLALSQN